MRPPNIRTRTRPLTEAPTPEPDDLSPFPMPYAACELRPLADLQIANRQLRRRSAPLIERHAACMEAHGVDLPIFATRDGRIVYGHDTAAAYRHLKRERVPVIFVDDRSPAAMATVELWMERFHADGEWDYPAVKEDFELIFQNEPDLLAQSGWDMGPIDLILHGGGGDGGKLKKLRKAADTDDEGGAPVTRPGDVFTWSRGHRAICGNSRHPETYAALMSGRRARLLAADPPFGTSVAAISSRHAEWKEGSGVDEAGMTEFFQQYLAAAIPHLMNAALVYNFMDHKGMHPLLTAFRSNGLVQKNICIWDKLTPGLGGFHMNQSEFIAIAKHGDGKHVFNPKLGINSTIWSVAGYAGFRPDRKEALANHACTKPQGVLLPILLMAAHIGDICLDPFLGSGSIMLAAERTKRLCYGIEIEERFVDTTVRRMHGLTGEYPIHEESGLPFDALAAERGIPLPTAEPFAFDEL